MTPRKYRKTLIEYLEATEGSLTGQARILELENELTIELLEIDPGLSPLHNSTFFRDVKIAQARVKYHLKKIGREEDITKLQDIFDEIHPMYDSIRENTLYKD